MKFTFILAVLQFFFTVQKQYLSLIHRHHRDSYAMHDCWVIDYKFLPLLAAVLDLQICLLTIKFDTHTLDTGDNVGAVAACAHVNILAQTAAQVTMSREVKILGHLMPDVTLRVVNIYLTERRLWVELRMERTCFVGLKHERFVILTILQSPSHENKSILEGS